MSSWGASHPEGLRCLANFAGPGTWEGEGAAVNEGPETHTGYVAELARIFAAAPDKASFLEGSRAVDEKFLAAEHAQRLGSPLAVRAFHEQPIGVAHAAHPCAPPPPGLPAPCLSWLDSPGRSPSDTRDPEEPSFGFAAQSLLRRHEVRVHGPATERNLAGNAGCWSQDLGDRSPVVVHGRIRL